MGLAKKRLKLERSIHLSNVLKGIAIAGISAYGSVTVFRNGVGEDKGGEYSSNGVMHKLFDALTEWGILTPDIEKIVLSGFLAVLAIWGIVVVLRSLYAMSAKNTCLGKSIIKQMRPNETLREIIKEIDEDMEREHVSHGPIHIGRNWILMEEAVRISDIIGIFTSDGGSDGMALTLMDKDKNLYHIGFERSKGERVEDAAMSLHAICPGAIMGNTEDFLDVTEPGWREKKAVDASEVIVEIAGGQLQTKGGLRLNRANGIPSSNFTWNKVRAMLKELKVGEELSITLLEPTKPHEQLDTEALIARRTGDLAWEMAVSYTEYGDPKESFKATYYYNVSEAMRALVEQKTLPDFSTWEQRSLKVKEQNVK